MIDLINEIESHDLLWSVRRCNIEGEKIYRAVVWTGASGTVVSEEASSPSIALGFAFEKAKTELGIAREPTVRVSAPTPGSHRIQRERKFAPSSYGTDEPLRRAVDLDNA